MKNLIIPFIVSFFVFAPAECFTSSTDQSYFKYKYNKKTAKERIIKNYKDSFFIKKPKKIQKEKSVKPKKDESGSLFAEFKNLRKQLLGDSEVEKVLNITNSDRHWLALNIFHEARGENLHGKMAVAFVTLNRVVHRAWPDTIKDVVTQPYQFSWYNSKKVPPITAAQQKSWEECKRVADLSIELYNSMAESEEFEVDGLVRGANHYFADYIKPPKWAAKMVFQAKVGRHLFYSL